jgi:hypothetical protein
MSRFRFKYTRPYTFVLIYPAKTTKANTKIKGLLMPPLYMVMITEHVKASMEVILYVNPKRLCLWNNRVLTKFKAPKTIKVAGIICVILSKYIQIIPKIMERTEEI